MMPGDIESRLSTLGFQPLRLLKNSRGRMTLLALYQNKRVIVKLGWGSGTSQITNEAQVLSVLHDMPIVPRLHTRLDLDDVKLVAIEYIPYKSLNAVGRLNPLKAVTAVFYTLASLVHIHGRGFAHCDLKPGNVIPVPKRGMVFIDFGVARPFDAAGFAAGTPGYTCPEALGGETPGSGCDLYSLAGIYYYLVTGLSPPRDPKEFAKALSLAPAPSSLLELFTQLVLDPEYRNSLDPLQLLKIVASFNPQLLVPHIVIDGVYKPLGYGEVSIGSRGVIRVDGRPVYLAVKRHVRGTSMYAYTDLVVFRRGEKLIVRSGESIDLEFNDLVLFDNHILYVFILPERP